MLELMPPHFVISVEESRPGLKFDLEKNAERILVDERDYFFHRVAGKKCQLDFVPVELFTNTRDQA